MAPAWYMHCDPWREIRCAHTEKSLWTGQIVTLASLLETPGSPQWICSYRTPAPSFARCAKCIGHVLSSAPPNQRQKQDCQHLLWKTLFQDHTRWLGDRHQGTNSRPPDLRHKEFGEALWLNKCCKPDEVYEQLAILDAWTERVALVGSSSQGHAELVRSGSGNGLTPEFVKEMCKQGQVKEAVDILEVLVGTNSGIDKYLIYSVLKECVAKKDLVLGGHVHALAVRMGFGSDTFLCNHFIRMYAGHGMLREAMDVFRGVALPDSFMWSSIISAYAKQGRADRAIELYQDMRATRMKPDNYVFVAALQACAAAGDLQLGKQMHDDVLTCGMEHDKFICTCLIDMYIKCGSLMDARSVFSRLGKKDVVTWTVMIAGYAKVEGMGQDALNLYSTMRNEGIAIPDVVTFVCLLQACANVGVSALEEGQQLHSQIKERRLDFDMAVGGSLVNMYAKCGSITDARIVFDGLREKNVVVWSAMIAGYAKVEGMGQEALNLYSVMHNEGISIPNVVTYVCLLQACANVGLSGLEKGKQLHLQLKERLLESDTVVGATLVNMYAKCGSLTDAKTVFEGLLEKNVVTWNAMIAGYARVEGMGHNALSLYSTMHNEGKVVPDVVTFVCLLQACANVGVSALEKGKQLHAQIKERSFDSNMVLGGSLVNMYAKCGSPTEARSIFDGLCDKNVVTWSAMIAGYARVEGMGQDALSLYSTMHNEGMAIPDAVTFVCLLQACADVGVTALEKGKQLHSQIKTRRLESDTVVGSILVHMYAKCGSLTDARIVFDGLAEKNVVTWNAMIAGYAQQDGMGQEALGLYSTMHNEAVAIPDAVTFVCLLQACANVGVSALETGKQLHSELEERGLESDPAVGGNLVNMYAKCGSLTDARIVFDGLCEKHVVTWNALISGYAQQEGMGQDALSLYSAMLNEGKSTPTVVTFVCLLQACASVGALQQGKLLHSEICKGGFESNVLIGTCLVKMYAQCGRLEISREVFDRLPMKSLETWTALLKGYAEHGEGGMAIQCFEELLEQGGQPNEVTYICLLTACSHAGLVDEGQQYFETMEERHGVKPDEWHYTCMVDLLGRSGHLDKAEQMLRASGLVGSVVSWTALMSACKSYGDAVLGRRCFDHIVNLQPTLGTAYVLLGSIYANAGRWDEVQKVEILRKAAGARKKAAKACIEVNKEVHKFTVGEERSDVAATLRKMNRKVSEGGHVPQTQLVLRPVSEQKKEDALCGHAEKLAVAYGLLNTPSGSTLVVTKNLRMCNDCHSSTKIMSRMERREIVVRDSHKVHRFQNGACSCQDRP